MAPMLPPNWQAAWESWNWLGFFGFQALSFNLRLKNTWLWGSEFTKLMAKKSFLLNYWESGLVGLVRESGVGFLRFRTYLVLAQHYARVYDLGPWPVTALV